MLYIWQRFIEPFLNSSFFLAFTTAAVALSAWAIFVSGKKGSKRDAANVIYLEIKEAGRLIKETKKTLKQAQVKNPPERQFPEKMQVMKTSSWSKYRHLFSRDLKPEHWNDLNEFYLNCRLLDEALAYIDSAFSRNETEVRANAFRVIANYYVDISKEAAPDPGADKKLVAKNEKLIKKYKSYIEDFKNSFPTSYSYAPLKPYQDAEYYLDQLPANIVTTDVGKHIKQLAQASD